MLTLHHLEHSQSFRILWLLEELGLPYELKVYQRTADNLAPPEYKAISPLGTSPTITTADDDDDGVLSALSESNAIMDFILDRAAAADETSAATAKKAKQLRPPPGSPERTRYLFWFHASPASFQLIMSVDSLFRILPNKLVWPISALLRAVAQGVHRSFIDPRLHAILQLAEKQLSGDKEETTTAAATATTATTTTTTTTTTNGGGPFLAGGDHLTAADITSIYSFDAALERMPHLRDEYPACSDWLDRMRQRPAFQSALKQAGEETLSLPL